MKKTFLLLVVWVSCWGVTVSATPSGTPADPGTLMLSNGNTLRVEACAEGVFRVRISPRPSFEESLMERYGCIKTDWAPVWTVDRTRGAEWTLATKEYALTVNRKTGTLSVADAGGAPVLREIRFLEGKDAVCNRLRRAVNSRWDTAVSGGAIIGDTKEAARVDGKELPVSTPVSAISIRLEDGERFYGGGSASHEHIQHRGELLRMWATYQQTEIPMPFMMSSRGWGIYDNTTRKCFFDVGSLDRDLFNILNTCDEADFFLLLGEDMPAVLDKYTLLTGRTYVLPKWAYGFCFGPNMLEGQFDILRDAAMFRQADVPCDLFWLEPQWMAKFYDYSTAKDWDYDRFSPEPFWIRGSQPKVLHHNLFIGRLREMGFRLGLWLCSEYDQSLVEEDAIALREGRDTSGREHWMDHLTRFLDQGVAGFKLDGARTFEEHPDRAYYNGSTDAVMHNLNQVLLTKQLAQMGRKHNGRRSWHHYCAGWSGSQHWGAMFSGDNGGGRAALFDQLNLGMSGFLNTSCDVMYVSAEEEMPSLHFGFFLPWVQVNSWFAMLHPFYLDKPHQDIYRFYAKLRYSLAPYIYSMALSAVRDGMPIVRAMPLVFPDDRACDDLAWQYMFGPWYCVGVFSNEIYLPAGTWTDAWTGERIVSKGETVKRTYPEGRSGLLFIRDGAIIPTQGEVSYLGVRPFNDLTWTLYPHGDSSFTLLDDDGESYGFEDGSVASTLVECHEKNGAVRIVVHPVEGGFAGMPGARSCSFAIRCDEASPTVLVDGKPFGDWTAEDGMVRFSLEADRSVSDKIVIEIL